MDYPINYHILAEDFRFNETHKYTQSEAAWLHESLCEAYDKTGVFIVGLTEGPVRLAVCATQEQAEQYIGTLPNHEDGRYYIDGPCTEPITLNDTPLPMWLHRWCVARLKDSRDSDEIDRDVSDAVIEREAEKLTMVIYQIASSFVDNNFIEREED